MVKFTEVIPLLVRLIEQSKRSERRYREGLAYMRDGNEKALLIYLWQEHARMIDELQQKVRWLGGYLPDDHNPHPWGGLHFGENSDLEEISEALMECERTDADTLADYDYVLKSALPVDVRNLLKFHVLKIKNIRSRVVELLAALHATQNELHFPPDVHLVSSS